MLRDVPCALAHRARQHSRNAYAMDAASKIKKIECFVFAYNISSSASKGGDYAGGN